MIKTYQRHCCSKLFTFVKKQGNRCITCFPIGVIPCDNCGVSYLIQEKNAHSSHFRWASRRAIFEYIAWNFAACFDVFYLFFFFLNDTFKWHLSKTSPKGKIFLKVINLLANGERMVVRYRLFHFTILDDVA